MAVSLRAVRNEPEMKHKHDEMTFKKTTSRAEWIDILRHVAKTRYLSSEDHANYEAESSVASALNDIADAIASPRHHHYRLTREGLMARAKAQRNLK